ncbi:M12 family metallopeptidase [Pseudomonas sp. AMR01]|uniref:M12 family metallopeptidase n=1 Tax=Pseudomonas sp. AMR01 TaxID=3064904 RepID=UPI0035C19626
MINPSYVNSTYSLISGHGTESEPSPSALKPQSSNRKKRGVAETGKLWPQRSTLTIAFMEMSKKDEDFIIKTIKKWAPYINLTLAFGPGPGADIKISGSPTIEGDWSACGTDALLAKKDEPTMHIDLRHKTEEILERTVLHEFGHALGLLHEHQHPDRTLDFNVPAVYRTYGSHVGWPKEQTHGQVLKKADPKDVITSAYDPDSIMHYDLPAFLLWQQSRAPINYELSHNDKTFIRSIYPGHSPGQPTGIR